ncbi:hypothetical protein [Actinophytocola sp.]|uniref:hypothetical protein n=1 Tax=Actinophytocola sp. TaxID=1872138 RepID=UPI003D6A3A5A
MSEPQERLIVTFTVDADREAGLNSWYNLEHVAPRLGLPVGSGFQSCHRYVVTNGTARFLNMYDLDPGALNSDPYGEIRDFEEKMDDVAYYTGHFKNDHSEDFRRLVVRHGDILADNSDPATADAVILDVVTGVSFEDLPVWGVTGLTGRLRLDPAVRRSTVWPMQGAAGFVIATDVAVGSVVDWRRFYQGTLAWLPEDTFGFPDDTRTEVVFGHRIARFARPAVDA